MVGGIGGRQGPKTPQAGNGSIWALAAEAVVLTCRPNRPVSFSKGKSLANSAFGHLGWKYCSQGGADWLVCA
jgi:hypothetical protein